MENRGAGEEDLLIDAPQDTLNMNCQQDVQMEMFSSQLEVGGNSGGSTWPQGRNLDDSGINEVTEVETVDRIEDVQMGELKHRDYFLSRLYFFISNFRFITELIRRYRDSLCTLYACKHKEHLWLGSTKSRS